MIELGLGLIELLAFGFFFILMVIGTALDRRYNESPKWYILGLGLAIAAAWFWQDLSFTGVWETVQSWSFWKPAAIYLAAGLAYSVLEFVLSVRKMARVHAESWAKFIKTVKVTFSVDGEAVDPQWVKERDGKYFVNASNRTIWRKDDNSNNDGNKNDKKEATRTELNYRDALRAAQSEAATPKDIDVAAQLVTEYLRSEEYIMSDLKKDFIQVELNDETHQVQPVINRKRLAGFIGAWTFLWPAYAVSLLIGDFLVEIFRMLGDLFAKMGGRFVRFSFAGVFKV